MRVVHISTHGITSYLSHPISISPKKLYLFEHYHITLQSLAANSPLHILNRNFRYRSKMQFPMPFLAVAAGLSLASSVNSKKAERTQPTVWGNGYVYSTHDCTSSNETIVFMSETCFPLVLGPRESFKFLPPDIYEFPEGCFITGYSGGACNESVVIEIDEQGTADTCWDTGVDMGNVAQMNSLWLNCSAIGL